MLSVSASTRACQKEQAPAHTHQHASMPERLRATGSTAVRCGQKSRQASTCGRGPTRQHKMPYLTSPQPQPRNEQESQD
eukprot:357818-Chlamydomonas_euryale.AAC.3